MRCAGKSVFTLRKSNIKFSEFIGKFYTLLKKCNSGLTEGHQMQKKKTTRVASLCNTNFTPPYHLYD